MLEEGKRETKKESGLERNSTNKKKTFPLNNLWLNFCTEPVNMVKDFADV